jgi:transcriptional regulator GlxA family with amidase domain
MTLALIQEDFGSVIAQKVARELVMRLRPPGEPDEPFSDSGYQCGPFERLSDLPAWIIAHLDKELTVVALAERTGISLRHFRRLFREVFNCAPAAFVVEMRLSEARRRLLGLSATVESVAESVGFRSPDVFCRAFERRVGLTPTAFRHQGRKGDFGQSRPAQILRRANGQRMRSTRVG